MEPAQSGIDRSREDGVALIYVLLVALIVGGVVAVTFASALSEQRLSAAELQFEDTVHVAEAGAEEVLGQLGEQTDYANAPAVPCGSEPGGCTPQEEREWALEEAKKPAYAAISLGEGESVGLRPANSDYVYGVGFVPTRDAVLNDQPRSYARVVRMLVAYPEPRVDGDYTFLGDVVVNANGGGNSTVIGGVKSNDSFLPGGTNWTVDRAEYVRECEGCPSTYLQVATETEIEFDLASDLYDSETAKAIVGEGIVDWYDFCDGATWKVRQSPTADPCSTGEEVDGDAAIGFDGTQLNGEADGVYYFDGGEDVDLSEGGEHTLTVITTGTVQLPTGSGSLTMTPAYQGQEEDDVGGLLIYAGEVTGASGNPTYTAPSSEPGIIFAADLDDPPDGVETSGNITIAGNASSTDIAWIAGNTFRLEGGGSGRFELTGAAPTVDPGTPPSPALASWLEL